MAELEATQFAAIAQRLGIALRSRGMPVPAFRAPPRDEGLTRSVRRYPDGQGAVVAVRIRGRELEDVVVDMVAGAVVAALGEMDEALVAELLPEALALPIPAPEPPPLPSGEEPF